MREALWNAVYATVLCLEDILWYTSVIFIYLSGIYAKSAITARGSGSKLRRVCGLPALAIAAAAIGAVMLALILLSIYFADATVQGALFTAIVLLLTVLLIAAYPIILVLIYGTSNTAKRRINKAARKLQTDRFEGTKAILYDL